MTDTARERTIEVRMPYAIVIVFDDNEYKTGVYQIKNVETDVVEVETSLLPQAYRYLSKIAADLSDAKDEMEGGGPEETTAMNKLN